MNFLQKNRLGYLLFLAIIFIGVFIIRPALTPTTAPTKPDTATAPTDGTAAWDTYANAKYGYSISYPQKIGVQEFPDTKTGANFGDSVIVVDVSAKVGQLPYPPIGEYVKTAATQEIQNFEKLNSLETVTTESGVTGYETTWVVAPPPMLSPPPNREPTISSPITYFAVPGSDALVLKVWLNTQTPTAEDLSVYNQMIKSVAFQK